jgi:hypothetical protein
MAWNLNSSMLLLVPIALPAGILSLQCHQRWSTSGHPPHMAPWKRYPQSIHYYNSYSHQQLSAVILFRCLLQTLRLIHPKPESFQVSESEGFPTIIELSIYIQLAIPFLHSNWLMSVLRWHVWESRELSGVRDLTHCIIIGTKFTACISHIIA